MTRSPRNKTVFILSIVALAIAGIVTLPVRLGLDLRGGASLVVQVQVKEAIEAGATASPREIFEQTRRVIERKINAFGLSEAPVQEYGNRGNELLIQLPGVADPAHIKSLLKTQAVLEWYALKDGEYSTREEAYARNNGVLPLGAKLFPMQQQGGGWFLVSGPPVIRGSDLKDARAFGDESGGAAASFVLSQEAAERFERYTRASIGQRAAIVLDKQVISVATIESAIGDSGQIRGLRGRQEAEDLAFNLRAGSLPAGIVFLEERTVEPSLGADSIRQGIRAGILGLAAVVVAMLIYYRRAGVNAIIALVLNGLLLVAALSYLDAVLTLPGIAGVILTVGMAVDSNVLIFERIREERRAGKSAAAAVDGGFRKAFGTIIDTHVTTVVSCGFLFLFGTPAVKGFAITLVIGLLTNVFTSVFVSKTLFDWESRLLLPESHEGVQA
jgi:preprotein translocase subunit SecD